MDQEDYLEHHGVKGMKWGVRKQGTQKSSFRKRVSKITKSLRKNTKKERLKKMSTMTTKELNDASARMEAEKRYLKNLDPTYTEYIKKGAAVVGGILLGVGTSLAKDYVKGYTQKGLDAIGLPNPNPKKKKN